MTSLLNQKGIVFDITSMDKETFSNYFPTRDWSTTNHVLAGFNWFQGKIVLNYTFYKPSFEEPESMIYLDHTHYPQFEMLWHLDWEAIQLYFEPLNLRKPT